MARSYLFDSMHKPHLLSRLLSRRSKHLLKDSNTESIPLLTIQHHTAEFNSAVLKNASANDNIPRRQHSRDPDFYLHDAEGGFLVFLVENTLFKIHRCLLLREPSAFVDMITIPSPYADDGKTDNVPVLLTDSAEQFRDLLWALYAPPSMFLDPPAQPLIPLKRLLNIAEMSNKYGFESYISWAIRTLCHIVKDPNGPLCNASPELLAHVLHVAALCDYKPLMDALVRHLIFQLLWYNMHPAAILKVAERHRLTKVIGVIFYKELIGMEHIAPSVLSFPSGIDADKRMQLLAAQQSLVKLWHRLRVTPPPFHHDSCLHPPECGAIWSQLWVDAASASSLSRYSSADVLGRLKAVMISIRRTLSGTTKLSIPCTLAALESISRARDDVIDGLIDHFVDL